MGGEVGFGLGLPSGDGSLFVATGEVVGGFPTGLVTFDACRLQPMNAMVMNKPRKSANLTLPFFWRLSSEGWSRRIMGSFSV